MLQSNSKKLKNQKSITGLHILGEVYTEEIKKLNSMEATKKQISGIIKKFGLHKLGSFYYKFPRGNGFTGLISLVESHMAIHTWPELHYLTLDVYLCNYSKDNSSVCRKVFAEIILLFKPIKIKKIEVMR